MQSNRLLIAAISLATFTAVPWIPFIGTARAAPSPPDSPAFREFAQRVQQYVKLRKAPQRTTRHREEIVDRRDALAQAIRESRPDAKQGDIFTPEVSEEFRRVIQSVFQGPSASSVRRTIRQGDPVAGLRLTVNGAYPQHLPLTTVPPTLLSRLPELPERMAYRIVGHDFVLQDTEARLVIDFIPGVIP